MQIKKLFLFLAVFSLLTSGVMSSIPAFADSDDDQHDGKVNKKNRVWTGDGPPLPKLGKVGDLYIDNHNDTYNIYKKTGKNTWTNVPDIQGVGTPGPQGETGPAGNDGADGTLPAPQSCDVGDVVTGIDSNGMIICATDQIGTGGGSSGQLIVVQRSGPTIDFSTDFPFRSSFAPCLSGETVVGGGYRASVVTVNVSSESMESIGGGISGWLVNAYSASGTGSITALAECATIAP